MIIRWILCVGSWRYLQAVISRSKLVKLPKAGHLPLLENAEETAAIYIDFLKAHARGRYGWQ